MLRASAYLVHGPLSSTGEVFEVGAFFGAEAKEVVAVDVGVSVDEACCSRCWSGEPAAVFAEYDDAVFGVGPVDSYIVANGADSAGGARGGVAVDGAVDVGEGG